MMRISFTPLKRKHAEEIVSWRYQPPYDVYDYRDQCPRAAIEYLTDTKNQFFAVLRDAELIAFRSFGPDGRVPGGEYDERHLDTGGGLRPDLTGQGLGAEVVRMGIDFGAREFETDRFRVTIAAFNKRALRVCRRLGFTESARFRRTSDEQQFVVLTLEHVLPDRRGEARR